LSDKDILKEYTDEYCVKDLDKKWIREKMDEEMNKQLDRQTEKIEYKISLELWEMRLLKQALEVYFYNKFHEIVSIDDIDVINEQIQNIIGLYLKLKREIDFLDKYGKCMK